MNDLAPLQSGGEGAAVLFRFDPGIARAVPSLMAPQSVKTGFSTISREADGIVSVCVRASDPIDVSEAERVLVAIDQVSGGQRVLLLVDLSGVGQLSRDAEKLFSDPRASKNAAATAFVGKSALDRALGNVLLMLTARTRGVPAKMFGNEAEARVWLQTVVNSAPARRGYPG